jgi:hypothetical protein
LGEAGELALSGEGREHLVRFMTLFGRFWILEAFVDHAELKPEVLIPYYLDLLRRQLGLFATPQGKASLARFAPAGAAS